MRVTQSSEHVPDPPFCQSSCFDLVSIWGVSHKCFQVGEESPVAKNRMFEKASCNIRFNTFYLRGTEREYNSQILRSSKLALFSVFSASLL